MVCVCVCVCVCACWFTTHGEDHSPFTAHGLTFRDAYFRVAESEQVKREDEAAVSRHGDHFPFSFSRTTGEVCRGYDGLNTNRFNVQTPGR